MVQGKVDGQVWSLFQAAPESVNLDMASHDMARHGMAWMIRL